eukprot:TRINITY_DN26937_c0_g1_i3.p6 TRINITY_DN26937_c0_g1~~TRINITY_DN26937_c0_g1_i3.p6  ORF type:complete len:126 (-),score=0.81 TRINITY_DN26937_c0_g1_i3:902-1279(-)
MIHQNGFSPCVRTMHAHITFTRKYELIKVWAVPLLQIKFIYASYLNELVYKVELFFCYSVNVICLQFQQQRKLRMKQLDVTSKSESIYCVIGMYKYELQKQQLLFSGSRKVSKAVSHTARSLRLL